MTFDVRNAAVDNQSILTVDLMQYKCRMLTNAQMLMDNQYKCLWISSGSDGSGGSDGSDGSGGGKQTSHSAYI